MVGATGKDHTRSSVLLFFANFSLIGSFWMKHIVESFNFGDVTTLSKVSENKKKKIPGKLNVLVKKVN